MTGRMIFPLNAGVDESTFTETYTDKGGTDAKNSAYKNVSVNPLLYATGLEDETDYVSSSAPTSSAIFTEIHKGPHTTGLVSSSTGLENRILPTSNSLSTYATNRETTSSHKVKIHDANESGDSLVTYNGGTGAIQLDFDDYDYFILLNPEIVTNGEDTVRPHFAKITRIVTFDTFGDGVEFSPRYTGVITQGTNFEIFKGPIKTATDIVAVSYGLRGDASASTNKYDKLCLVNRPTFYFYNDRLEEKDQLDYNEKYTLTSVRVWTNPMTETITMLTVEGNISQYQEGSTNNSGRYYTVSSSDYAKLTEGMSLFDNSNNYIGNVEDLDLVSGVYRVGLDYYRPSGTLNDNNSANLTYKIGKTIQNVVFKTERKYGDTIQNLGRNKLDAVLVDTKRSIDEGATGFNPIFWHKAFPDMKRHEEDHTLTYDTTNHAVPDSGHRRLNGPSTYITFKSAALKNDKLPLAMDSIVNNPKSKISKFARTKAIDNSGTQHLKYKEDSKMIVRNGLFSDTIKKRKLDHTVTTSSTKLKLNKKANEYDYRSILSAGDIIEIGDYYYRVGTVDAPVEDEDQTFAVTHNRLKTGKIWIQSNTPPTVTNAEILVSAYSNGKFNIGFASDTEIKTDQNDRITMDNHTISKASTKMNKCRISLNAHVGHELKVDYGDKTHKYVTIQEPTKTYYQRSPKERMYYYQGGFTLHEEVFNGLIEDTQSRHEQGRVEFDITGRDNISKLLSNTVNRNLNFSDDMVYSTLNPALSLTSFTATFNSSLTSNVCTAVGNTQTLYKYDLLFDSEGNLIGELASTSSYGDGLTTYTLTDNAYVAVSNGSLFKYYKPLDTSSRFISGAKAISVNPLETTRPTDFTNVAEKGIIFNDGFNYTYASNAFSYSELELTSNSGNYHTDKSLGYDITNCTGIEKTYASGSEHYITSSNLANNFLLQLADENDVTVTKINKDILSAAYLNVAGIENIDDEINIVSVAPNFPVSLAVSDTNGFENRFHINPNGGETYTPYFYFINSNLPLGGYIHKLQDEFTYYYGPKETYRYIDMQKFDAGTLTPYNSRDIANPHIYKLGTRPHKITGYSTGVRMLADGRNHRVALDKDTTWHYGPNGKDNITDVTAVKTNVNLDDTAGLINNDYRARPYRLYATGDLYPDSYLRYNNMGFSSNTNAFNKFGLLFESKGTTGSEVNHSYTGKTKATVKSDKNYERSEISSATITNPTQMKRWGVIRLIEATFDWHFNSVDAEAIKKMDEIPRLDLGHYGKYDTNSSSPANAVTAYNLFSQIGDKFDSLTSVTAGGEGINMTQVHLITPNIGRDDYLGFSLLEDSTQNASKDTNPHNVILPIISNITGTELLQSHDGNNYLLPIISALHVERNANSNQTSQLTHYSKVLSALCKPIHGESPTIDKPHNVSYPDGHIYDNCIAIFKDFRTCISGSNELLTLSSSPLELSSYNLDSNGYKYNQHNQNTMVRYDATQAYGEAIDAFGTNNDVVLIGTKTKEYPFTNREGFELTTTRDINHVGSVTETGEMYSAQMLLKPQFNITSDLSAGTGLSFTMNTSSTHHWLNYVPNLEGYYIVGDKLTSGYLPTPTSQSSYKSSGIPQYIGKIVSHTRNDSSAPSVHTLKFDKSIDVSEHGLYYRLMRISDTTFEDTPNEFEINLMHDSGLKYETVPENLLTGTVSSKNQYGEGIYSMYMLLNIDQDVTGANYLERRTIANAGSLFTNGDEIDCYITDGINSQRKSLTVTKGTNLKFEYDGTLTGNGCVSFGKIFDITIPKKLKINPTNCYLGTSFSIGSIIENEISSIVKESDLELDIEKSFNIFTDNIISSTNGDVITCVDNVINISAGDLLYTQEGYLLGKVATNGVSNKTITLDDLIYIPDVNTFKEIVKKDMRTMVSQVNFNDIDAFSAINFLANKKGLDYKIENNSVIAKNLEDTYSLRKYHADYEKNNRLISVESNKNLFDKANKIIVQGDGVRAEVEIPAERKRVIRHVDTSIKNKADAQIKALQLLEIHQSDIRKVKLKLQKEGLELLEAGDIFTLDFPNHGIPRDDYEVFEIENVLSGITTITVGTHDKTIAERLSEMTLSQKMQAFNIFSRNSVDVLMGKVIFDDFKIQNQSTKYEISSTTDADVIGFTATVGFDTTLGFGSGSTTILKTYESEKDV